ncbi:carbohydrate-binding family 9-like protein [Hufsiella ginkgonis]|uniref:Carbohydrate-binding domain-containing protein n=1 Tax=Hufsiella ginkgonis TaxID=2695274 RepID=A0A7K1Y042_9SPHI|nr:carbohydrate-binding family 9-like protein [Hufsiella ginkgonis]MXV16437.1 hypothetical protein [Hufsiella ginkgonis]
MNHAKSTVAVCLLCSFLAVDAAAQSPFQGLEHLFTQPKSYPASFTARPPVIDGEVSDAAWATVAWSSSFVDIEGDKKPSPRFDTRIKMLWNDTCLFIAAELKEPHVWANLRKHDEVVFYDNDFEVFIDPDNNTHQYYEIEVNALNTIFDLFMPKPYRNGSGALIPYDTPGMKTAVKVHGTLNDPSDTDQGWTVEMRIPFRAISMGNGAQVPQPGAVWRINFSRVEWDTGIIGGKYVKKKDGKGRTLPENNWVWSPQGVVNMHYPERWGYLQFVKPGTEPQPFKFPHAELRKQYLWLVYYKQKAYFERAGKYAPTLTELGISGEPQVENQLNRIMMETAGRQFNATITEDGGETWSINDEGLIQTGRTSK